MGLNQNDFLMAVSLDLIVASDLVHFTKLQYMASKVWGENSMSARRLEVIIDLIASLNIGECLVRTEESKSFVYAEYRSCSHGS
jgi:hypothetical protein